MHDKILDLTVFINICYCCGINFLNNTYKGTKDPYGILFIACILPSMNRMIYNYMEGSSESCHLNSTIKAMVC